MPLFVYYLTYSLERGLPFSTNAPSGSGVKSICVLHAKKVGEGVQIACIIVYALGPQTLSIYVFCKRKFISYSMLSLVDNIFSREIGVSQLLKVEEI